MLCDSNILIYAAYPSDTLCLPFVERDDSAIAVISRIEVLGFPGFAKLSETSQKRLEEIVSSMLELELTEQVIQQTIALRQQKKMSLADSMIAATALVHNIPLVTRNIDDFKHIEGLKLINPFAT